MVVTLIIQKKSPVYQEIPLSIIGHSMGGLSTVYAAMAEPNIFKSIVLVGPLIKPDPNVATPIRKTLSRGEYLFLSRLKSFPKISRN